MLKKLFTGLNETFHMGHLVKQVTPYKCTKMSTILLVVVVLYLLRQILSASPPKLLAR